MKRYNYMNYNELKITKENLIPIEILSMAIGRNENLYKYIDKTYEQNLYKYNKCVYGNKISGEIYDNFYFKELNFKTEYYSRRAFCILSYGAERNLHELNVNIEQLIIKGWEYIEDVMKEKFSKDRNDEIDKLKQNISLKEEVIYYEPNYGGELEIPIGTEWGNYTRCN